MSLRAKGSGDLLATSTTDEEIIPLAPAEWSVDRYVFKDFSFINKQACHVIINGSDPIFLDADQGYDSQGKINIDSFIIKETSISYQYLGYY